MARQLMHIIPVICSCLFMQIILHEVGHLLGGLITGWQLVYIQLHRFIIKKTDKGIEIMVVEDLGYRCIMYPKSFSSDPFLYTIGGCIINLLSGIIGIIFLITIPMNSVLWLYVWSFAVFGIGMFFMNWIESLSRVCNDKACYRMLKENLYTKLCHNLQLIIAKDLMTGLTYKQIGKESIYLYSNKAVNDIEVYQVVLEYYYFLDIQKYMRAGQALESIDDTEHLSKELQNIIKSERIYLLLLTGLKLIDIKQVDRSHIDIEIDKYKKINVIKGDIHSLRVYALFEAYKQYKSGSVLRAVELLDEIIKLMETSNYVYEGERKFCIQQIKCVINHMNKVDISTNC